MASNVKQKRRNAMAFYDQMFNQCRPQEAVEHYGGDTWTQQSPHVADGKQSFIECFERLAPEYPGKQVIFKRTPAKETLVVLPCHQEWPTDQDKDWAGIDIIRLDQDGKLVEHWDVLHIVPSEAKHNKSMF